MADDRNGGENRRIGQALYEAAERAGRAPSILNTQPWRWRIRGEVLELYADPTRQVTSIDPRGRLMTVSCGAALHHARLALAAAGYEPDVARHPEPDNPHLLARVRTAGRHEVGPQDIRSLRSMRDRHSDRRPFPATVPVPEDVRQALHRAAAAERAWLHRVEQDQMVFLRVSAERAQRTEAENERFLDELQAWTYDRARDEGVRENAIVAHVARPIPLRDLAAGSATLLDPGFGDDRFADYLLLATDGDEPSDWLRAGEATSAVWLTATAHRLAVSAISEVIEVPGARALLRSLLHRPGHPQLLLRVGFDVQPAPPPASPRRPPSDVIDIEPP